MADTRFYTSARWRRFRLAKLREDPLCEICQRAGKITAASEVHHIVDRKQAPDRAYDPTNVESACKSCHSRITMTRTKRRQC